MVADGAESVISAVTSVGDGIAQHVKDAVDSIAEAVNERLAEDEAPQVWVYGAKRKRPKSSTFRNAMIWDGKHEHQNPNIDKNKTVESLKDRYLESERALEEYRREITTAMGCVIRMIDTKSREATETKEEVLDSWEDF